MKPTVILALGTALTLISCSSFDPEYAEYKKEKEAGQNAQAPYSGADPYGAPTADPYGAPGPSTGVPSDVGRYTPQSGAPYQPLPGIPAEPTTPHTGFPTIPNPTPTPGVATGPTTTHVVTQGDSLWGLARKYGTSVEAIQQANGLTGDTIQTGRTILIPSN